MRVPKNHVAYPRKQIIKVLRTLNELVVSLDRLGSVEMTKQVRQVAVADFIQRHKIFQKAARACRILSEPFPTTRGADDMDELEQEMLHVRYWNGEKRK
jgi:hypothetical protein